MADEKTVEERLAWLEGVAITHGLVLHYVVAHTWRHPKHRAVTLEAIESALTRRYGELEPTERAHQVFRSAVDEAESLFRTGEEEPRPDPS